MLTLFKELAGGISHLFYPRLCDGCNKPLVGDETVLCIHCELHLPETEYNNIPGNETALRFVGRVPFHYAATYAYFVDDGLLQHLIHGLKYKSRKDVGLYLGKLFGQQLQSGTGWIREIDAIIPVPLHPAKEAVRGYNQSELIASGMGGVVGKPIMTKILTRNRETESQTKKTRTERVNNMAGAFNVSDKNELKNRHVLLIDDVLTTGATLEACALALMVEESVKISVATIGIAVS